MLADSSSGAGIVFFVLIVVVVLLLVAFGMHAMAQRVKAMRQTLLATDIRMNIAFGPAQLLLWCSRQPVQNLVRLLDTAVAISGRVADLVRHTYGVEHALPSRKR